MTFTYTERFNQLKVHQLTSQFEKTFCQPNLHFVSYLWPNFDLLSAKIAFWPGGTTIVYTLSVNQKNITISDPWERIKILAIWVKLLELI